MQKSARGKRNTFCFIALSQSERELSSLLKKRAQTEAGLALTGPLGTDQNVS